ncbi:TonB-dependent receptor [Pedobacter frigidisoli]|uniref:TonB-dependent receptor n=1 Tax=Pedobacter frigidisoli TaxID=2530455 RepID=A0A4R0P739_9SPHI|nr:carboxypeptidase-like regulatory domain-containing protein [Pedobacter frigidisoli]TCD12789.1 TonB-dependent receptor [Pedobacter frigidisoli]
MILKRLLLIVVLLSCCFCSFSQAPSSSFTPMVNALEKWSGANQQEKIYLHTDKPYYLVGDTIWLKAYITMGSNHQPSTISGAVYIDLMSEGDSVAKSLKLPVMGGMAKGDFVLNDSLTRDGNYRIRAYTEWMRNAGTEFFYDRTFSVGNSVANDVFGKIDYVFEQADSKAKVKAIVKFTNASGKPYGENGVSYSVKEGYRSIASGRGKTNAAGEISINLPSSKAGEENSTYLVTSFTLDEDTKVSKTFPLKTAMLQTDFQFFPEGGLLLNDVWNRVAFKATGISGLGVPVTGTIVDNEQKEVATIETQHLGMGYINLMPETGKTYTAKIKVENGSEMVIKLPEAKADGYSLSVYGREKDNGQQADTVLLRINANPETLKKGPQQLNLIAQSGGTVYAAMPVNITKPITSLYMPIADVPSGVLQFTLFSSAGIPTNERVFFVQKNDQMDLKVTEIDKHDYKKRDKVSLGISSVNPAGESISGNLSIAVINEDAVPADETKITTIFSQLLLKADIKGYVEQPNYYFFNPSKKTRDNLDLLMLTQGYRRFNWKNILDSKSINPAFKPEKIVNSVTGQLKTLGSKPLANGSITLLNNKYGILLDTVSNQQGKFSFNNLIILDGTEFTIRGRNPKGGKLVEVLVDKVGTQPVTPNPNVGDLNADILSLVKTSLENSKELDEQLEKHGMLSRVQTLREVNIRARGKMAYGNTIKENQADEIYRPDSRRPCKTLMDCLMRMDGSRVNFVYRQQTDNYDDCGPVYVPMFQRQQYTVIIDGMTIAPCDYQTFFTGDHPADIDKVYFSHESKGVSAKLTGTGTFGPVMAVFTRTGNFRRGYDPSVVSYFPKGYNNAKEFYNPKYNVENNANIPDLRTTVYWNPSVITGKEGKAEVSFFNSDQTGNYLVVVEGINGQGLIGRSTYRFKVN